MRYEEYQTDDADLVVVAYGVVSRIVYSTVDQARGRGAEGRAAAPHHPVAVPHRGDRRAAPDAPRPSWPSSCRTGQMVEDVRLAVEGTAPVHFYGRCGGMVPGGAELRRRIQEDPGRR